MHIGIEASALCSKQPTGIGRYTEKIIKFLLKEKSDYDQLSLHIPLFPLKNLKYRRPYTQYYLKKPRSKYIDVFHGTDHRLPYNYALKNMMTIHDLFIFHENAQGMAPQNYREKKWKIFENVIPRLDGVITVGQQSKKDIMHYFNISEKKISVVPHGVDEEFDIVDSQERIRVLKKYKLPEKFIFFVGSISERKNTERMVEAFIKSSVYQKVHFVMIGNISHMGEKTVDLIKQKDIRKKILLLPFIEDQDLVAIYNAAKALFFVTLYEGFGIPILEAFSTKTPVLASKTGESPYVAQSFAALANPYDIDEISDKLEEVLDWPTEKIELAYSYARQCTWQRTAQMTYQAYQKVLS